MPVSQAMIWASSVPGVAVEVSVFCVNAALITLPTHSTYAVTGTCTPNPSSERICTTHAFPLTTAWYTRALRPGTDQPPPSAYDPAGQAAVTGFKLPSEMYVLYAYSVIVGTC